MPVSPGAAPSPPPHIHGVAASATPSNSAASKRFCRSRSNKMSYSRDRVSLVCFSNQHLERRYVCVPLDQGRNPAEALYRGRIQLPNGAADGSVVSVDENFLSCYRSDGMTGKVDFP